MAAILVEGGLQQHKHGPCGIVGIHSGVTATAGLPGFPNQQKCHASDKGSGSSMSRPFHIKKPRARKICPLLPRCATVTVTHLDGSCHHLSKNRDEHVLDSTHHTCYPKLSKSDFLSPQVIELACKDHLCLGLDIRPSCAHAMFLEFLRAEMIKQKQMPSRSSARRWSKLECCSFNTCVSPNMRLP